MLRATVVDADAVDVVLLIDPSTLALCNVRRSNWVGKCVGRQNHRLFMVWTLLQIVGGALMLFFMYIGTVAVTAPADSDAVLVAVVGSCLSCACVSGGADVTSLLASSCDTAQ